MPDLWTPLTVGAVQLKHRVVLAPLTRNRASSTQEPNVYEPNSLMLQYYEERATDGGLLISEATFGPSFFWKVKLNLNHSPVSLRASGIPGIPGIWTDNQAKRWQAIVEAVHRKGGLFYMQLWHQGRNTHSMVAGQIPESSSATPITDSEFGWSGLPSAPFEVPHAMTVEEIHRTQDDFVNAAVRAREIGFDGIEVHAGNGYLVDQFLHSNINTRTDAYGGTMEKRCKFAIELMEKLATAVGADRVAIRLSPFGLFNQSLGSDRVAQWTYLCSQLARLRLAYVHMIEPRFDELRTASEKNIALGLSDSDEISLAPFKAALESTPLLVAGGYSPTNCQAGLENGAYDFVAFGRYFTSNPDLVERIKTSQQLYKWNRARFYGPFPDNAEGYTTHSSRVFAAENDHLKPQLAA